MPITRCRSWPQRSPNSSRSVERLPQRRDGQLDGSRRRVGVAERVQHDEVVDDRGEPDGGRRHPGLGQLGGVRLALVPQYVGRTGDHERRRQAGQLLGGRAQRRRGDLVPLITAVAGRPLLAHQTAFLLGARLGWTHPQWTPDLVEQPARSLVRGETLMEGLLAWTLIGESGRSTNWAPTWRSLLVALRNHPEAEVRQLALDLTTAPEA